MSTAQEALFSNNPVLARQLAEMEDFLYRQKNERKKDPAAGKYPPVTLPVVFHIVHNNGAENISDAQVLAALGHLNDAFAHTGYFNQEGENTGIQFCLAKRTPEGLATSGITRTESALTNIVMEYQDLDLKDLIRWDPTRYINIWVVASITSASQGPGVAGYAYLPFSHGSPFDGMVCEAEFLGFEAAANAVLIHEMGHYLGLYHTFEGGCPNSDCLLEGDRVCDTPPDQVQHSVCSFNSCDTDSDAPAPNPFTSDVNDLGWNFMDYSDLFCYAGFTAGQSARMQDIVASVRKSLLESDACLDPCTQLISAAFAPDPPTGLSGEIVQLVNTTTGASQYEWYVNGVSISNAPSPAYTFGAPGVYTVTLIASNADANCTEELEAKYVVTCPVAAALTASQTQVLPGETVSFSNNSVNALSWQWTVNGIPSGNAQTLDYQFNIPGVYTVALTAGNGFCSDQAAVSVQVEGPCGGLVKLGHYRSGVFGYPKAAINSTMFHSSGDIFGVGAFKNSTVNTGLLAKWNGAAQLQWVKRTDDRYFHKALETPDGNWVAYSSADLCVTAKFSPDGDVLWARSFDVPGADHPAFVGLDHLAVFPNGDIAVLIHGANYKAYLFRLDSDGNLLWQKSFNTVTATNIDPANDGSNNLMVTILGFYYFIISADGQQILEMKELVYVGNPGQNGTGITRYNQHPDGSFTVWSSQEIVGPPAGHSLVLFHFSASGDLLWTKSFETPQFTQNFVRYYPGDGWLFNMNLFPEHILMRINDDGTTRWTRRFTGSGPAYFFHGISGLVEAPDGRVAGVSNFVYDTAFYLLLFDPRQSDNCDLVDVTTTPGLVPPVVFQDITRPVTNSDIPVAPFPLVLTDAVLHFQSFCDNELPCIEICGNGFDDDYDGQPDCADSDCQCQGDNVCIPDALVSADSLRCRGDSLLVYLQICNNGGGLLPAGTPLQWYSGNPVSSNAAPWGSVHTLPFGLPADSCATWVLEVPLPPGGALWGVFNDDGSQGTPFDPGLDFPVTNQPECDFFNNLFSVQFSFSPPVLDLGPDRVFCSSSVVALNGGQGFARYRWANGTTDSTFTAFGPGTYWLDAWDVCGNLYTDTVNISLQTSLPLELGPDRAICPGDALSLSVSGFDQVKWSPAILPCTDCPNLVFYPDTAMLIQATGRLGDCFVSDSVRVSIATLPVLAAEVTPAGCTVASGSIALTASGGTAPYTFNWAGGASGALLDGLAAGEYIITVSAAEGCPAVDTFQVPQTDAPAISGALVNDALCYGAASGSITAAATGGTPPYQFQWSNGSAGAALSNLAAGIYELALSDAAGCSAVQQFVVGQPAQLVLQALVVPDSCNSQSGSIEVSGSGGTPPFDFQWENGAIGAVLNNLAAGSYVLSTTDALGCLLTDTFTVTALFAPVLTDVQITDAACSGAANGAISLSATGGATPYTFTWSTGTSENALANLPAGQYALTLSDANGCSTVDQFSIAEPAPLLPQALLVADTCGQHTGSITLTVTGGTAPYDLNWSDGASGAQRNGLAAGQYAVFIQDAQGCVSADTFNIEQLSAAAIAEATISPVDCHGAATGSIHLTAADGQTPYVFQWSNGATGATLSGLPAGDYTVTLSDALGCSASAQYVVNEPQPLLAVSFVQNDTCGQHLGSIDLSPAGGTPPWAYQWSTGAVSEDLSGLPAGNYSATVTDASGCVYAVNESVQSVEIPAVFVVFSEKITCSQPLALAAATPPDWAYQWLSPAGQIFDGAEQNLSEPGEYQVAATNAQGCTGTQSHLVEADLEAPVALLAANQIALPCNGSAALLDGSASSGGSGFARVWSFWANGTWVADTAAASIWVVQPGLYRLAVTDLDNGCVAYDTAWVLASEGIDALWPGADSVSCFGWQDGRIRVDSVWGGVAPFEYALAGQAFSPNALFEGLPAGSYTLTVRDMAGCTESATIDVGQPEALSLGLNASALQIAAGATVTLTAEIEPAGQLLSGIQWLPESLFPDQNRLLQTVMLNENTLIEVRIATEKGCADTAFVRVEVLQSSVYVPNAFAPGRPGNDGFTAFGGANLMEISVLRVFDRWGELLFERQYFPPNNPALGWDGRFRGREVPEGVYVYHVELRFANGDKQVMKGEVVLVR